MASAVPQPPPPPQPPAAAPAAALASTAAAPVPTLSASAPVLTPSASVPVLTPSASAAVLTLSASAPVLTPSASGPAAISPAASPQPPLPPAVVANTLRLVAVVDRLSLHFKGSIRCLTPELSTLSFALAKSIDYALTVNDVPAIVHRLPSIIKQVYHQHRNDSSLQSAIMVVLIAAKNACQYGWFHGTDAKELLTMANELSSSFCMAVSATAGAANVLDTIIKIIPRYYPRMKLCRLIVSFEAKTGYDILMSDFHIARSKSPEERIRLFVSQKDDLETSSCIISPPHVSFLVNGKGVERRTSASPDNGPQYPTDITKMLKYGTNIIQAMGYFSRNYIIAVAYMTEAASSAPELKDYVQPTSGALALDSDITEGPSRISLNCPISFRRIKIPVKGHLCRHHQCFDYENFMEMNSRKPSWRCPCCNQPVSCIDLRIDQNMSKILGEVGQGVTDIVISSDGSWKVFAEHNGSTDHWHTETHEAPQGCSVESECNGMSNTLTDVIDLTMEDGEYDSNCCEAEDIKPDIQMFPNSEVLDEPRNANHTSLSTESAVHETAVDVCSRASAAPNEPFISISRSSTYMVGTLESLLPRNVMNPVITDAVSPALNREFSASTRVSQSSLPMQHLPQVSQHSESMQLQQPILGYSIVSSGTERQPIPRHVNRVPAAVQALPVQAQGSGLSIRTQTNVFNANSVVTSGSSAASYQTIPLPTAIPDGWNAENGNTAAQQLSRTSGIGCSLMQPRSIPQVQDHLDRRQIKSPSGPQVVGLAAPNPAPISTWMPLYQTGTGAYRPLLQPLSGIQSPRSQLLNSRVYHSANRAVTMPPNPPPHVTLQIRQATQNAAGATVGSSANLQSQLLAQMSTQNPAHGVRPHSRDTIQPQKNGATTPRPAVPSEQNWRPTGRMRGSLTGREYSAALSQYLTPLRAAAAQPPISDSDQVSVLTAKNIRAPEPMSQDANLGQVGTSNQPGGSCT